ncbi:hypothetical protein F4810DRAFT_655623 [Camillea tinctor]|nr:hypothetical protein F4810DRAFT_655623 [Camillea tinctor]
MNRPLGTCKVKMCVLQCMSAAFILTFCLFYRFALTSLFSLFFFFLFPVRLALGIYCLFLFFFALTILSSCGIDVPIIYSYIYITILIWWFIYK